MHKGPAAEAADLLCVLPTFFWAFGFADLEELVLFLAGEVGARRPCVRFPAAAAGLQSSHSGLSAAPVTA